MLDGSQSRAGVIVGQNWGAGEIKREIEDQGEGESQGDLKMVDLIHQQQQEMHLFKAFDHREQQQQQQNPGSSSGFFQFHPGFSGRSSSSSSLLHHNHQLQQRRYHFVSALMKPEEDEDVEVDEDGDGDQQQELRMFFPSSKKLKTMKASETQKEKGGAAIGENLLSLGPPSSALSDITTNNSEGAIDFTSDQQKFRAQQQRLPEIRHQQQRFNTQKTSPPGMELLNMLLECAQAVESNNLDLAMALLSQLKQGASIYGDSMQRLAAHFSEGLATRILRKFSRSAMSPSPSSSSSGSVNLITQERAGFLRSLIPVQQQQPQLAGASRHRDYLGAFTALYTISPFFKLAHFTANQSILEATESSDLLHIVDLDIMQGLQWPSFIQALASRPSGPPKLLRITGLGPDLDSLQETGNRLESFAAGFSLPFKFHAIPVQSIGEILHGKLEELIQLRPGEALAVNSVLQLHRLLGIGSSGAPAENLGNFLAGIKRLNPCAVTIAEQEAAHNSPGFIPRFVEALHYYAAVFDSLDASLPQRNEERVLIEQALFAAQIRNIVSCEGAERVERHEKMGFWSRVMSGCGFNQLPMSSHSLSQAKLLLQLCPCDGYRVVESANPEQPSRVGSISLGWQDRLLLTTSSWA